MKQLTLLLAAAALFVAGCSSDESESAGTANGSGSTSSENESSGGASDTPRPSVAFVTNQIADFWKIAEAGCQQAESDFDVDVEFIMPQEATAVIQKQKVEDLLTSGVQAIAISPLDAENQVDWINEIASQVPLITHDSDCPQSDRLMYIGMDNYAAGRMCGELVEKALPDGGQLLLCIGRLEQDNAKYRRQGVIDVLLGRERDAAFYQENPDSWEPNNGEISNDKYTIVATVTDQGKPEVALQKAEDALVTWPDLKAMVGLFEYNPPACLQAIRKAGKNGSIQLIGFDENDMTLQAIKDGECIGTVVQNPYEYGYQSVRVLTEILAGKEDAVPESRYLDIAPRSITADNVDEFWEDLRAKKGQ